MVNIKTESSENPGMNFIPTEFLPGGEDEYHLRNLQNPKPDGYWRHLLSGEIERLVKNGNSCDNWDHILVTERFNSRQIKSSHFFGLVRIDNMEKAMLEHHDLRVPSGITNSRIISCDIGECSAVHNVSYMGHYILGRYSLLMNIDEIHTTNYAKFGNGILKDGEQENLRVWVDLMNETGCRRVLPFDGMITADACMWAKFREYPALQERLKQITQQGFSSQRGFYGTIGEHCVVKHSKIIKDVKIGSHCYIKGANKLKNLTINSSEQEPTQIGESVEIVNGIIGFGCKVFYGCKAVRFMMGNNCKLKYGARLLNAFLGDNSTVSCCEMLNNLIFPAHEQHHNDSFLIAALVMGQSNIAAGVTAGSNHNSRSNDGEIQAGRGFWPGLCSNIKHSSKFASFTLLSKGGYPAEINNPLPFSLLNTDDAKEELQIMPGYWWLYNMYALARNSWKFQARDKRITKAQNIEFDYLAPDTVEELLTGRSLLEQWTGKSALAADGKSPDTISTEEFAKIGGELLNGKTLDLDVFAEGVENSRRKTRLLKVREGYQAYGEMLHYYAVKNLVLYMQNSKKPSLKDMQENFSGERVKDWTNLGGQIIPLRDVQKIMDDIQSHKLGNWDDIHQCYNQLWEGYALQKQKHAYAVLLGLLGTSTLTKKQWSTALNKAVVIQELIRDRVYNSRKKDYDNPFRLATFQNKEEMDTVMGFVEDDSFVQQVKEETEQFKKTIEGMKSYQ
ncbi:MAG: DUF4954 family protein [Fibrobacteria bacterium]|nr:DUF4954 family protein [Fibrobacteria bacterium]